MTSANTATPTKASMISAPTAPSGYRRTKNRTAPSGPRTLAPARLSSASWSMTATPVSLLVLDARVERDVGHVDDEVDQHHHDGDEHDQVLHDRIVAPADRFHEEARDAGDVEHGLGDDQAADQERGLDADDG